MHNADSELEIVPLNELEKEVKLSREKRSSKLEALLEETKKEGMRQGRIRPRDKTEERILNSFKRKR